MKKQLLLAHPTQAESGEWVIGTPVIHPKIEVASGGLSTEEIETLRAIILELRSSLRDRHVAQISLYPEEVDVIEAALQVCERTGAPH